MAKPIDKSRKKTKLAFLEIKAVKGGKSGNAENYRAKGKFRWNVVPLPGVLSALMWPRWASTIVFT